MRGHIQFTKQYLTLCHALVLHSAGHLPVIPVFPVELSALAQNAKIRALIERFRSLPGSLVRSGPVSVPPPIVSLIQQAAPSDLEPPSPRAARPIVDVFSSYAHEDVLKAFKRSGLIRPWNDRIDPGQVGSAGGLAR
jgi:hypothetical protein